MAVITGTSGPDTLNGTVSADEISGLGGADTLLGNGGADMLLGGGGDDSLLGGSGADSLVGGTGTDTLDGGSGGDTYRIDASDVLIDSGGIDTIRADFSYALLPGFENLVLFGDAAIDGTGNSLANIIAGNNAANLLSGLGGEDTLSGAGGNDTLLGGNGHDSLSGGGGADSLVGGAGVDTLNGAGGNDIYVIDASDQLADSGGIDAVHAAFSYTLLPGFENLVLLGGAAIDGTGNNAANTITGNNAANLLRGGSGNDIITGGGGADVVRAGEGNDVVRVSDLVFADVDGGSGRDKVALQGTGHSLDLTMLANIKITGIEVIGLTGSGDNTLTLSKLDLLDLSDTTNVLRVRGDEGDAVTATGAWSLDQLVIIGDETYADYTNGAATLRVDIDIDRSGITVSSMNLSALDGKNGFRLEGGAAGDVSGNSVAAAGDMNGDGFDDVLIGTFQRGSYVVFGKASGFASSIDLSTLDGTNGFRLDGAEGNNSGFAAGDVNGDGFDDVIVGAHGAEPNGSVSGASYVVFGKATGFASSISVSTLDGANGFRLEGVTAGDASGQSVSTAGDVNGDGFGDVIIGARYADPNGYNSGASYVVFGRASGFASSINLSTLDGTNGFRLEGVADDESGVVVAAAGDVNGDGFGDVIVGAFRAQPNGTDSGASYVVFGKASGFDTSIKLSTLDGTNGFRLEGVAAFDLAGRSGAAAGDVNGDGFGDVIVGAFGVDQNGASYVVFGKATGFASSINLSTLDGTNGFRLEGVAAIDFSGRSVAGAGDVNGDGFGDVIVGAYRADPNGTDSGASYVVFGRATGFASSINLSTLDGTNGFRLEGVTENDYSGRSVAAAGDVNGDGFDDLIVGAPLADPNGSESGATYVVFGGDFSGAVTHLGTTGADTLTGTAAAERFVSAQGNDTVTGGGGADVFRAGEGNNVIRVPDLIFADIDGGSGNDKLVLQGSGHTLDLTSLADNKVIGIETINLNNTGDNTLELAVLDLLNLSDTTNQLTVDGNGADTVELVGAWSGPVAEGDYMTYTSGAAKILIDADILVT